MQEYHELIRTNYVVSVKLKMNVLKIFTGGACRNLANPVYYIFLFKACALNCVL